MVLLISCSGNGCVEPDEFGDTGSAYVLNVFANSVNCGWDNGKAISANTNLTIKACLDSTSIASLNTAMVNEETVDDLTSGFATTISKNSVCSVFDRDNEGMSGSNKATVIFSSCVEFCQDTCIGASNSDADSMWTAANLLDPSSPAGIGVVVDKDAIYTIKATGAIYLTSGELNEESSEFFSVGEEDVKHTKTFSADSDIKLSFYLKNITNSIVVGNQIKFIAGGKIPDGQLTAKASNIFISFIPREENVALDTNFKCKHPITQTLLGEHSFQHPHLYAIGCTVGSVCENNQDCGTQSVDCRSDYSKALPKEQCDLEPPNRYYEILNSTYNTVDVKSMIFPPTEIYYYYVNNIINDVAISSSRVPSVSGSNPNAKPIRIVDIPSSPGNYAIKYVQFGSGVESWYTDSYLWNGADLGAGETIQAVSDSRASFNFIINKPTKLAIKRLDSSTGTNCGYVITESISSSGTVDRTYGEDGGSNTGIPVAGSNVGKWKVLKGIGSGDAENAETNEIVFNQFSTPSSVSERTISIRVVDTNSSGTVTLDSTEVNNCNKMLIKLLPLKDYVVDKTGIMFLATPNDINSVGVINNVYPPNDTNDASTLTYAYPSGTNGSVNDSGATIKYTILNPKVFSSPLPSSLGAQEKENLRRAEFFENAVDTSYNFLTDTKLVTTTANIIKIDTDNYNDLIENHGIFVRKGQVVRFDYSNWLEFTANGAQITLIKKNIAVADNTVGATNNRIDVPVGMLLMNVVKERENLICVGVGDGLADFENYCNNNGGEFLEIGQAGGSREKKCFIANNNFNTYCYVSNTAQYVTNMYKLTSNCTISSSTDLVPDENVKLVDFLVTLSSKYDMHISATDCFQHLKNTINETYNKGISCFNYLYSGNASGSATSPAANRDYLLYKADYIKNCSSGQSTCNENYSMVENGKQDPYLAADNPSDLKQTITQFENEDITALNASERAERERRIVAKKIEWLKKAFRVEIDNHANVNGNISTTYKSFIRYYNQTPCAIDADSGQCIEGGLPLCYDLKDYAGSIYGLLNRIKARESVPISNEFTMSDMSSYGRLSDIDRSTSGFGAVRLSTFNGERGLISAFEEDYENEDTGHTVLKYTGNLSIGAPSYLSSFFIKHIPIDGNCLSNSVCGYYGMNSAVGDFSTIFKKKYIKPTNVDANSYYMKVTMVERDIFRNGDRLGVFFGDNGATYTGLPSADQVRYLVSYKENIPSLCSFNADGVMVNMSTGEKKIDMAKFSADFRDFLDLERENNKAKNLFFKIIDKDNRTANNSGSYKISIISNKPGQESGIVGRFRDFISTFFSFLDGKKIRLYTRNGNKLPCPYGVVSDKCSILKGYSSHDVINSVLNSPLEVVGLSSNTYINGDSCKNGDSDCYLNCNERSSAIIPGDKCENVSDGGGVVKNVYLKFTTNPLYQFIIKISLVLMLSLYGFNYFLGKTEFKTSDMIYKIIRVCFIYFIISESGWTFFEKNVIGFFKDGIDSLLFLIASSFESDVTSRLVTAVEFGDYNDKSVLFESGIDNIGMLLSDQILNKIVALPFSSLIGLVYLYLILSAVISYVAAILTSIILYLNAQLYMTIVFSLFPIVVLFMMFDKTKGTFDNWYKMLFGFVFQQIFLVLTLSFFNAMVRTLIRSTFSYRVCFATLFNMDILGVITLPILGWKVPGGSLASTSISNVVGFPNFYTILMFYIFGTLMGQFINAMVSLGNTLVGGSRGIGDGVLAKKAQKTVDAVAGKADAFVKGGGSKFVGGMANRFGLNSGEEYNKKREEQRKARRDSQKGSSEEARKTAMDKNRGYAKSKEFKENSDRLANSRHGKNFEQLDHSQQEKIRGELLEDNYNKEYRNKYTKERMKSQDVMDKFGYTEDDLKGMNDDEKADLSKRVGDYLEDRGEVRKEGKPLPPPTPPIREQEGGDLAGTPGLNPDIEQGDLPKQPELSNVNIDQSRTTPGVNANIERPGSPDGTDVDATQPVPPDGTDVDATQPVPPDDSVTP